MEQQTPSLKLVFLQGPRQGETLHYPPGSSIRIGRIARGNNLSIKDFGISSKHLSITSDSGKWVLLDLDSSNGTVLNSNKVTPLVPFHLHHDSTIKIGELTSIHVTLVPHQQGTLNDSNNVVRNPTRPGLTGSVEPGLRGDDFVAPPVEVEPAAKQRRGRSAKGTGLNAIGENESGLVGQSDNKRVTRNAKHKRQSVIEIPDSSGYADVEVPKKMTRATRNLKKEEIVIGNSDAPNEKVEEPKNIRVTRNMKNKGIVIGGNAQNSNLEECGVEKVEGKKKKGRGCAKKKIVQEESVKVAELEESKVDDEVELNHHSEDGLKERSADEKKGEDCCAQEENLGGKCNWPGLERMSLGEWFDFLEVQLPKQVIGSTEEIIDSMRHKAERLRNYITEQNNDKGKMPV
ncbi:hypothetical protein Lal_00016232 [Lupinus albus]|uniref:Putative transcription factor interactor and regulator FHA-SMAD family n=1 Tax=Lupinus albus TaxID=3870 RepID=A0A6A4QHD1_LUPAL|nr:putative transcription factor interactor and regulator FHA-SMAD family [Lupinus albus]KAF1873105.1 hypothetical protein Lal_00016232 [Lupinus albus]